MKTWYHLTLAVLLAALAVPFAFAQPPRAKAPYNVLFIISDQEAYRRLAGDDYNLPARRALQRRGVTFRNHYIASAVCTPSRAALFTGQPPQVTGVFDQMYSSYMRSLDPTRPNMGSVLKGLGYRTAYFGKFELDQKILEPDRKVNYSGALQPYGFDGFAPAGDAGSGPHEGYVTDDMTAAEGVQWLRRNVPALRRGGQPFFTVLSFVNPHDIMFADANVPGRPPVQKAIGPGLLTPPPDTPLYRKQWAFTLPASIQESLTAPGMPEALREYHKGWCGALGEIPGNRSDMWRIFYNYYLNCLRDNDRNIQEVIDALDDMDLWKDTVVVQTADHGEMAGAHGASQGKGPFCYEANAHVPLVIAHPEGRAGASCSAVTSHLDLLPTVVGLTGTPPERRPDAVRALPGHDFSALLRDPQAAAANAVRPGVLFNYLGISTVDGNYLLDWNKAVFTKHPTPGLSTVNLGKRGFMAFTFDGRYKYGRFYAPNAFNTPKTLEQIFKHNDIQLFDLRSDPEEVRNLALDPEKNRELILRMNGLLNDLLAKEVGVNDGRFLPEAVRPKTPPLTFEAK